jgi:hypothetical protein
MDAAGSAAASGMCQQLGMDASCVEVVGLDADLVQNGIDERASSWLAPPVGELDPDEQFRCRDGGDRDVVLVLDHRG